VVGLANRWRLGSRDDTAYRQHLTRKRKFLMSSDVTGNPVNTHNKALAIEQAGTLTAH
jgi:hypothetical protein